MFGVWSFQKLRFRPRTEWNGNDSASSSREEVFFIYLLPYLHFFLKLETPDPRPIVPDQGLSTYFGFLSSCTAPFLSGESSELRGHCMVRESCDLIAIACTLPIVLGVMLSTARSEPHLRPNSIILSRQQTRMKSAGLCDRRYARKRNF